MNLNDYLNPLDPSLYQGARGEFLRHLRVNADGIRNGQLEGVDLALLGLPVYFDQTLKNTHAPDLIRRELYDLAFDSRHSPGIMDLGNMKKAGSVRETLFGLSDVLVHLMESGVFVLLLGGDSLLNLAVLRSLPRVAPGDLHYALAEPYLSLAEYGGFDMISDERVQLYQIGGQAHYHTQEQKVWTRSFVHETYRLGKLRDHLAGAEPYLRGADGFGLSVNVVRNADAPGQYTGFPNGMYGEDVCQLAGYAGLADHLKIFSVMDYYPPHDRLQVTARLLAQTLWYTIEGFRSRISENPYRDAHFKKFLVNLEDHSLVFYKSERTSRWWMEVPAADSAGKTVIPCRYADYQTAARQEIPSRWLRAYQQVHRGG